MKIEKEEYLKPKTTRIEILEERISNAENSLEELKVEFRQEDIIEMTKLQNILIELKEMKQNILKIQAEDKLNLDQRMNELRENSLLILNNHKVEISNENEKLKKIKNQNEEYIRKLEQDLIKKNLQLELAKKKENELIETNSSLEDDIRMLKSKAYGYDIAKKFEIYQNKLNNEKVYKNNIDPNRNKTIEDDNLAFSLWEKQYSKNIKYPTKLDDISKQNGLWIKNSSSNVEKLLLDIDSTNKREISSSTTNKIINTNMRKYSPMIINNING